MTWAVTAIAVTAVSAAASAYSSYSQGQTQKKIAQRNQQIAENAATTARAQGAVAEDAKRRQTAAILAKQRAGIDQAGIGASGTGADLVFDSAADSELDALNVRYGSELSAMGQENESQGFGFQGEAASQAGYLNAGSALLSGASSAYGIYKDDQLSKKLSAK